MQKFTIKGTLTTIGEVKAIGNNGFTKREIIVETGTEQFPSPIPMNLKMTKVDLTKDFNEDDDVEVDFTVDGRKWDGPNGTRYFVDLTVWGIRLQGGEVKPKAEPAPAPAEDDIQDLPF